MNRVIIFITQPNAVRLPAFVHGETEFAFAELRCDGPVQLVEGTPFAFVDWLLPDCSGLELTRRLRADNRMSDAHITLLLDSDDEDDRRRALAAGADDYAIAPLDRQAILDRVLALHDRRSPSVDRLLQVGDLILHIGTEHARYKGRPLSLRPNEFRVLRFFAENPNRIFSREQLIAALGRDGDPDYLRTVDVWIKRLRHSLRVVSAETMLRTVHGRGYVFDLI